MKYFVLFVMSGPIQKNHVAAQIDLYTEKILLTKTDKIFNTPLLLTPYDATTY
jgi:hypothetical protein